MVTNNGEKRSIMIRLKYSVAQKLKSYGNMHESYSDVIDRLVDKALPKGRLINKNASELSRMDLEEEEEEDKPLYQNKI